MKFNIAKYEFTSKKTFDTKYNALFTEDNEGRKIPKFKFAIVELGHIILEEAYIDDEGKEHPAVLSKKYCVDAVWYDLDTDPTGWGTLSVDIPTGEGVHQFMGLDYQEYKF